MSNSANFNGFSEECVRFFEELMDNNNKMWFEQHRDDYDTFVAAPSRAFVSEMGKRLKELSPRINADPRVNKSLFKIHRDTRFSKDKTPFKTHMGIMFWEGYRPRMECSCYYFHLDPPNLMLGAGIYMFPKLLLDEYRNSVVHPVNGPQFSKAITEVKKNTAINLGGEQYKKTPRGFDPEHENAEFLLYKGLHAGTESKIPKEFYSSKILDYCFERYEKMAPLHKWLVAMTERVKQE